jgi:membrane dipeptidase
MLDLIRKDLVGIGNDASEDHARPGAFLEWCNNDKGYARQLTPWEVRRP